MTARRKFVVRVDEDGEGLFAEERGVGQEDWVLLLDADAGDEALGAVGGAVQLSCGACGVACELVAGLAK
jgi:hypothetical protein